MEINNEESLEKRLNNLKTLSSNINRLQTIEKHIKYLSGNIHRFEINCNHDITIAFDNFNSSSNDIKFIEDLKNILLNYLNTERQEVVDKLKSSFIDIIK